MLHSWLITFRNPLEIWECHWSFLIDEVLLLTQGILTFRHAYHKKSYWMYLWISIFLHGLVVEIVSYIFPSIDNFWHAQATVMLFGNRLPFAVTFVYPIFIYTASVAANNLKLPWWGEPFAVGLLTVLLDIPFDIIGIKLLWWTWHDTDPNISDRHYWVPWTSYYFHAAFASSLTFLLQGFRWVFSRKTKNERSGKVHMEVLCIALTALLSMPAGIIQFILLYHPLHDIFNIHTEVCVTILFTVYGLIIWTATLHNKTNHSTEQDDDRNENAGPLLSFNVILYYTTLFLILLLVKPENIISKGLHQQIGNCSDIVSVYTPVGVILSKQKYLCIDDYDEAYFDWRCLSDRPEQKSSWYSICGTPFTNRNEYLIITGVICASGLFIYLKLFTLSKTKNASGKIKIK